MKLNKYIFATLITSTTLFLLLLPSTVFVRKIRKKEVLPAMALM